jgi:hypothetical protein
MNPPPVILEEVRYVPGLMPYIKERIDKCGGRASMLQLLPLSCREATKTPLFFAPETCPEDRRI